jgi:toxin ParE1/3/4
MKAKVQWTPQAREDLLDIYVTIGFDNPSAAERMFSAIEAHADMLASSPRIGVRRPEIAPSTRILVEGLYLILYETHPDSNDGPVESVEIVRILHGHRDLSRLF